MCFQTSPPRIAALLFFLLLSLFLVFAKKRHKAAGSGKSSQRDVCRGTKSIHPSVRLSIHPSIHPPGCCACRRGAHRLHQTSPWCLTPALPSPSSSSLHGGDQARLRHGSGSPVLSPSVGDFGSCLQQPATCCSQARRCFPWEPSPGQRHSKAPAAISTRKNVHIFSDLLLPLSLTPLQNPGTRRAACLDFWEQGCLCSVCSQPRSWMKRGKAKQRPNRSFLPKHPGHPYSFYMVLVPDRHGSQELCCRSILQPQPKGWPSPVSWPSH